MKAAPLVYTRTLEGDYREIVSPVAVGCPSELVGELFLFARAVVNEDNSNNGSIERIRWAMFSRNGWLLWGAGFRNDHLGLSKDFVVDINKRPIRGFIGIVISFDTLRASPRLPFGSGWLKQLFETYVEPIWRESQFGKGPFSIDSIDLNAFDSTTIVAARDTPVINKNPLTVRVFEQEEKEEQGILASALDSLPAAFTVVTGLNCVSHAQKAGFHNASVIGHHGEAKDFAWQKAEPQRPATPQPARPEGAGYEQVAAAEGYQKGMRQGTNLSPKPKKSGFVKIVKDGVIRVKDEFMNVLNLGGSEDLQATGGVAEQESLTKPPPFKPAPVFTQPQPQGFRAKNPKREDKPDKSQMITDHERDIREKFDELQSLCCHRVLTRNDAVIILELLNTMKDQLDKHLRPTQ